jgi:enediyne biosynthesis protein E4
MKNRVPLLLVFVVGVLVSSPRALGVQPNFIPSESTAGVSSVFNAGNYTHPEYAGGGAAGDFNRDGLQDLFILSGGNAGLPDKLYINNGNGTFTDRAALWGVAVIEMGKGVAVGDYNKDGWPDIYVTSAGTPGSIGSCKHRLYRNNAGSSFTEVAAAAGVACTATVEDGWGATFGDYDRDGDLDLFVAGFVDNNAGSKLFRNNGNGTFTDVTTASAIFNGVAISVRGFAPRFVDMNADLWPDLLLTGDFGTSRCFKNNGNGTFSDVTASSQTGDEENAMGQTVGDFDGNLLLDWYVTSVWLPAASWTGNKLYMNQGNHVYVENGLAQGVAKGGWAWGTVAVDFNQDTLLDLVVTNGDTTSGTVFANDPTYLWMNNGNGTFTDKAAVSGLVHTGLGRGLFNLDYDNDGDEDVVILANGEAVRVFRNALSGPGANYLRLFFDTSAVPGLAPDGTNSQVFLTAANKVQVRHVTGGDNYLSQSEMSAHFGMGSDDVAETLEVRWANGSVTSIDQIAANQTIKIMADGPVTCSPAPGPVAHLHVQGLANKTQLRFTWDNAPDATSYRVVEDSRASGGFELVVGDATSGVTGLTAAMPPGTKFFLIAGRKNGCQGTKK